MSKIKERARKLIMDILTVVDYDLAKSYDPETSDMEPEEVERDLTELESIVLKYRQEIKQDFNKHWGDGLGPG